MNLVPWSSRQEWRDMHHVMTDAISRHQRRLVGVFDLADQLRSDLLRLFGHMERLDKGFCAQCADVCCRRATVWFDFKDLMFLHLCRLAIPLQQPVSARKQHCRFHSSSGCMLDRLCRPWICNWYLCPQQTAGLNQQRPADLDDLQRIIQTIKTRRRLMETSFVQHLTE